MAIEALTLSMEKVGEQPILQPGPEYALAVPAVSCDDSLVWRTVVVRVPFVMLVGGASQLLRRTLVPGGCLKIAAASQPLRRTWRDYRMDEAVAAADKSAQRLKVDVAFRHVFQHPATDWNGPKKQPQIHLKHKIPLMIEIWKDFVPDTVTFWAGHPPALSASTALTVRNEADSAKQFARAVVDPVSDVVNLDEYVCC